MGRNTWSRGRGRGRGRGGYSSRSRGNHYNNNNNNHSKTSVLDIEFYILQGDNDTSVFNDVTNKIAQWTSAQSMALAAIASKMVRTQERVVFTLPTKPTKATEAKWDTEPDEDNNPTRIWDPSIAEEDYSIALDRYKAALAKYDKDIRQWEETNCKIFEVIRGQCSEEISTTIFADPGWSKIERTYDTVEFLIQIQNACGRLSNSSESSAVRSVTLDLEVMLCVQTKDESLLAFYKRFQQVLNQNINNGGNPGWNEAMYLQELVQAHRAHQRWSSIPVEDLDEEQEASLQEIANANCVGKYLAILFIKLAHPARFGHVISTLNNSSLLGGVDTWPVDLPGALEVLTRLESERPSPAIQHNNNNNNHGGGFRIPPPTNNEGVAFVQTQGRRGPTCYFCLGSHIIKFCTHPDINQSTINAIYGHHTAGTYCMPATGTVWKPPTAQLTGVGGSGGLTGVGNRSQSTGVANANVANSNDDASVITEATYASRQAAYAQANPGLTLPSPNEMADMLGYPCLFTIGAVVPVTGPTSCPDDVQHVTSAFADMTLGFDLMNVNVPVEDVHPAEAVVQAESPGDAPAPADALVTFGPDCFPRHFAYLRRGMIHNRHDLLHHGMQYALSPDKINKYEEVNDASIVESDPRTICGIAGRGCSLLCWKEPRTFRRILNEFGNVITSGRVGSFICVLVNTCGEEFVMQCHDYISVPNGTTVHSLQQILESPYQVHPSVLVKSSEIGVRSPFQKSPIE